MSVFTAIGSGLWTWEPFLRLERDPRDVIGRCTKLFWIALYTTPEAKMVVPGMFVGSVSTMADACRIQPDDARTYLDRLIEDDLVEYDVQRRVLRMTELPDCGESPANGKAILGWWRRFQNVPECRVRDAHVNTLRWIMDEWCRRNQKTLSPGHQQAWTETFGRITPPPMRKRSPRHEQTDLFTASGTRPANELSTTPSDPNSNKLVGIDSESSWNRFQQDPDPRSGSGSLRSEGGVGGGRVLQLVPVAVDADDLADALAQATAEKFPRALTKAQRQALGRAIETSADMLRERTHLDVLRDYVSAGMPGFENHHELSLEEKMIRSRGISPDLVATPGWLPRAIQRALNWASDVARKKAMLASALSVDSGLSG